MQGGFSFCGVDIAKYKLEYVPTLDQTYVFSGSNYEVHQEVIDAHHGGYFYGTTVQPKDFTLRCLYQDEYISHGVLASIENFFRRGKTGKLIFDKRNWVWYVATVVDIDMSDLRNHSNGFVTITMRAYYPFARHDYYSLQTENMLSDHIAANSGLLSADRTPEVEIGPLTESKDIFLYNGGSETAHVAIEIAGDAGEGVTIVNHTTGQKCKFVAFTKAETTDVQKYIVTDSLNGQTILTDGQNSTRSFMYHDHGFIDLAPSFPIERDVYVTYFAGSNQVSVIGAQIGEDSIGRHIMVDGSWKKIIDVLSNNVLVVDSFMESDGFDYTNIVTMNEIGVELSADSDITKLNFIYKPTFQ